MGEWIDLAASDGFKAKAWKAAPQGAPRGGIVVIQEIFGVNHHIRSVTDRFAAAGYLAIAPGIFDRVERNVELNYDRTGVTQGRGISGKLDRDKLLLDVAAAIAAAGAAGKVGIVGFCLGGSVAWRAAAELSGLSAAVGYYGGQIIANKDLRPQVPVLLHFGEKDEHIPLVGVKEVQALHPDVPIYLYPAGHGFHCDERASFDKDSAKLAWERSLEFFAKHVG
ncbi:MAG TPA: dienelactone hydrolase family protein [Roseiarcus sp.]|nr:dienelactone hydrolase family protein [Roseiarcus sp.]